MGRPKLYPQVRMTKKKVEELSRNGLTDKQIGLFFDVDDTTVQKRFSAQLQKGRLDGKIDLYRARIDIKKKQLKLALEDENVTMLIFLGKVYCGQSDRVQVQAEVKHEFDFNGQQVEGLRNAFSRDALIALQKRCLDGDPAAVRLWFQLAEGFAEREPKRDAGEPEYRALLEAAVHATTSGDAAPGADGVASQPGEV